MKTKDKEKKSKCPDKVATQPYKIFMGTKCPICNIKSLSYERRIEK